MTAAGLAGTLFSMWVITKVGRRTMFLVGFSAQAICMLVVAIVWTVNATSEVSGRLLVAFSILYLVFFNACTAPYLYLSAGEFPNQRLRSYTLGTAIGIAFLGNWLVSFTAPYFLNPTELNWVLLPITYKTDSLGRKVRISLVWCQFRVRRVDILLRS
jgi:MFS family permease